MNEFSSLEGSGNISRAFFHMALRVNLADGRVLDVPMVRFPRLLNATPEQREAVEITPFGLHWAELDEDISIPALLDGKRATHAA